jgi:hypothetical protein
MHNSGLEKVDPPRGRGFECPFEHLANLLAAFGVMPLP